MKQTVVMILLTAFGAVGAFYNPFAGVVVYYFLAALRPNAIWAWAIPQLGWSQFVAVPLLIATAMHAPSMAGEGRVFNSRHAAVFAFACWLSLTYVAAQNRDVAWIPFVDYLKIFMMMLAASAVLRHVSQLRVLMLAITTAVAYIAYEINLLYFTTGRIAIASDGFGGLDNNGAAVMLAMAVPCCLFVAVEVTRWWRWVYAAFIPVVLHAVLMTFSRGSMVALLCTAPLMFLRGRRRAPMAVAAFAIVVLVPILAGPGIRSRFFSTGDYEKDGSAQARFQSWATAYRMSLDYPVFGVGIRNSPLFALSYGADMEGRAIHNQYLQILCDSGYPALTLYLLMLALTWRSLRTVQRATRLREDDVGRDAYMVAVATECALAVFLVGSMFLSLELFELPYIFLLIGIQLPTALEIDDAAARADHPVVVVKRPPEPSFRPRTAPIALVRGSREGLLQ
jgi:probable O-glycosylation ligase (exosortase A-associated)